MLGPAPTTATLIPITALGQLVHQIARLEGHGRVFSLAIMTDGDPSMDYGIQTLDDVARALL